MKTDNSGPSAADETSRMSKKRTRTKNSLTILTDEKDFQDQLRVEGINFKGFGVLPKFVMLDPDLTIEAKTIYAYFCSFAGNGNSTFPSRNKILSDLNLSKDTYYKHLKKVTEQGYITVKQENRGARGIGFSRNIYTLVSNPKKFEEGPENNSCNLIYSKIRFSGLKAAGYGMIPKAVMLDDRLPIKAKGIYAYFCSFTGSGNNAFPKKETILFHLQITEKTYYKFYKLLTELNYITAVQRHIDGRLSVNDYYLNDMPDIEKATKKAVISTDYQDGNIQDAQKQNTQMQDSKNQDTQIQDTNKNSPNKNNFFYKQSINQQPEPAPEENSDGLMDGDIQYAIEEEVDDEGGIPYVYKNSDVKMEFALKHYMSYDVMANAPEKTDFQKNALALLLECLVEMVCADKTETYKGSTVSYAKVIDRLNECIRRDGWLNEFADEAIDDYISAASKKEIRDKKKYMKAVIWNSLSTYKVKFDSFFARTYLNTDDM